MACLGVVGASAGATAQTEQEPDSAAAEPSDAQNEEARSLYEAGAAAFGDGRFEDALGYWERSYELSGRPELLYNVGTAHDRLAHRSDAIENYQRYLGERPEADNRAYVERRIAQLEQQQAQAEEDAMPTAPSEGSSSVGGILLTSVGGAMVLAGVGTGLATNAQYSNLEDACPGMVCSEDERANAEKVTRLARATDALLIIGGVATLTGVIWWIVSGGDEDEASAQNVRVGVGPQGIDLRGRF